MIDLVVVPALGSTRLDRLQPAMLDRLYGQLAAEGPKGRPWSSASIRKVHAVIRAALQQAVKWGWVSRNVATLATPPGVTPPNVRPPTPGDVLRLASEARDRADDDLADFVLLAAVLGARRGELCALQWRDVNRDDKTLEISRAVVQVDGEVIVKSTKTHQGRRIALDPSTVLLFDERRQRCEERASRCGFPLGPWVFSYSVAHDQPASPESMTRHFARHVRRLGVAYRLHDLRHFAATQALDAGVALPTVSKRLGHRDTTTTANIYAHAVSESDRLAATVLARVLAQERYTVLPDDREGADERLTG